MGAKTDDISTIGYYIRILKIVEQTAPRIGNLILELGRS